MDRSVVAVIDSAQSKAFRYRSLPPGVKLGEAPGRAVGFMTDPEWLDMQTMAFPAVWQEAIRGKWADKHGATEEQRRNANLIVVNTVRELADATRAGLRLDSNDEQIRARARAFARHYARGIATAGACPQVLVAAGGREPSTWAASGEPLTAEAWALAELERGGMWAFWPGWVPGKPGRVNVKKSLASNLARVCCEVFWRRVLRKMFAKTIEACSIGLGLVSKARDCYVSSLSVKRRGQQVARNAASLERTELENEFGQRMQLSDLAAKSTANKAVRRAELMTRISGFDVVANDVGHEASFITVTCASRWHKFIDLGGGRVKENPKYEKSTPGEAQKFLSGQWAKCRAWLGRRGVEVYGFRVAEPHHDGCPHWHFLLFHPAGAADHLAEGFRTYFLESDSATERGAQQHRVKFERIDRTKGSAAAYLAKYISKNIDGYGVDEDLFGAPALESSRRVDAWASTWGIRQFQQLGGAPVGVWRELRRINTEELPADLLPRELTDSLAAVNVKDDDAAAKWATGWAAYVRAQGGPCVKRLARRINLLKRPNGEINRYTEARPDDVVGVSCQGRNWHKPAHLVAMFGADKAPSIPRPAAAELESERATWRVVGEGEALPLGAAVRPWTRVNNCTQTLIETPQGARSVSLVQRSKLGRWRARRPVEPEPDGFPASTGDSR